MHQDTFLGDNSVVIDKLIDDMLRLAPLTPSKMAEYRVVRENDSKKRNPDFVYDTNQVFT